MYASIRVYRNAGSVNELAKLVDERFLPAISTAPGFRGYYGLCQRKFYVHSSPVNAHLIPHTTPATRPGLQSGSS